MLMLKMKVPIIICVLSIVSFLFAYGSDRLSEPPPPDFAVEYQKQYESWTKQQPFSQQGFEELTKEGDEFLGRLNNPEQHAYAVSYILRAKLIIIPILGISYALLGFKMPVKTIGATISFIAIFIIFAIVANYIEAIIYAFSFYLNYLIASRKRPKYGQQTQ